MWICNAMCWRSWNEQYRTCRFVWPTDGKLQRPTPAVIATARSNTPTPVDQTSAARPVRAKFSRCCTASQGLVPLHLPREAIIQAIRWLLPDRSLLSGFSADFHCASLSRGGRAAVFPNSITIHYRRRLSHDHESKNPSHRGFSSLLHIIGAACRGSAADKKRLFQ